MIHERLRKARHRAGYERREDVAELLGSGFSVGTLHRWENGDVSPPFDGIVKLSELYNVSLDWLAGRTDCQISHLIDHGKVVVDTDGMERARNLQPGIAIPEDIISPQFDCVWTVPKRFTALNGAAADDVKRYLRSRAEEFARKRKRTRKRT